MNQPICHPHYHYPRKLKHSWLNIWVSVFLCILAIAGTVWIGASVWFKFNQPAQEEVVKIPVSLHQEQMEMIRKLQQALDLVQHQNRDLREYNAIQKQMIQHNNGVIPHGNR